MEYKNKGIRNPTQTPKGSLVHLLGFAKSGVWEIMPKFGLRILLSQDIGFLVPWTT